MKIGILGSGEVGIKLAESFIATGHTVKIGTRTPDKLKSWTSKYATKGSDGTFADASSFGDIIILATLWEGTQSALNLADTKNFSGKIVVDVTNPLDFSKGVPPKLALGNTDSAGETVQRLLVDARVV